jgi:DNA-binding IclR family transcriptional regulator
MSAEPEKTRYGAPALEKGLEVLELLAGSDEPMAMTAIAASLGRSRSEIYRVLVVLERSGYLTRLESERFGLTNRLFDMAMRTAPSRNLHDAALPTMHRLAETLYQSCHLVVRSGDEIVVVARVESPDLLGFAVRVGYRRPIVLSTSGRLLFASVPRDRQAAALPLLQQAATEVEFASFLADCEKILRKGFHIGPSAFVDAITDLGVPIFDGVNEGPAAALVVPFVSGRSARSSIDEALDHLKLAGLAIGSALQNG